MTTQPDVAAGQPTAPAAQPDERAIQAEAVALTRWATHLARLAHGSERAARKVARSAVHDISRKSEPPFTPMERDLLEALITVRLLDPLAACARAVRASAEGIAQHSPEWRAALSGSGTEGDDDHD